MQNDLAIGVKNSDRARYYSVLFAPKQHRDALYTLYAFDAEIQRIPHLVSEPALGAIRLQWWIEGLAGERREEMRTHPIGQSMVDVRRQYNLPFDPLITLIEERVRLLLHSDHDALADEKALESSFGKTHAVILHLAAFLLNEGLDPQTSDLSGHAGMVLGLIEVLRRQSLHIKQSDLIALAFEHLEKASSLIKNSNAELLSVYLPLVGAHPFLKRAMRKDDAFKQREISDLYLLTRMVFGLI